jgi:multidrug resistance efflux pump
MRRGLVIAGVIAVLAGAGWVGVRSWSPATVIGAPAGAVVPTARVVLGPLDRNIVTTGELRAGQSRLLIAPSIGGTLRILHMLPTGAPVEAGEVVIELDPTEQLFQLEQARSELLQADQEITKQRADVAVQTAQDKVELLTAQFDVRRAELDAVADKDLISANDYARRQLNLDEARKRLAQVERDVQARADASKASLAMLTEKRAKTAMAATRAEQNIETLRITAPIAGHISARENRDAVVGGFYIGMALPEYRAGDNTMAGRPLADIFDLSSMEIRVSVSEPDRPTVVVGQRAIVESDAAPGVPFQARVKSIAGAAQRAALSPTRQFDAVLDLEKPDPRLRPGASVQATLVIDRVEGVLQVPLQAMRQKDGKPVVYVQTANGFEATPITIRYRTESRIGLEGLEEGTVVALVDPDASTRSTPEAPPAAPATPAAPGGRP